MVFRGSCPDNRDTFSKISHKPVQWFCPKVFFGRNIPGKKPEMTPIVWKGRKGMMNVNGIYFRQVIGTNESWDLTFSGNPFE
jgi:hypothetical protein